MRQLQGMFPSGSCRCIGKGIVLAGPHNPGTASWHPPGNTSMIFGSTRRWVLSDLPVGALPFAPMVIDRHSPCPSTFHLAQSPIQRVIKST
jgi:hypothetical protein